MNLSVLINNSFTYCN